jgi:hypothetical protein
MTTASRASRPRPRSGDAVTNSASPNRVPIGTRSGRAMWEEGQGEVRPVPGTRCAACGEPMIPTDGLLEPL